MKTSSHRPVIVTLRTRTVGQNFGTCGQIVARNGRVLAESDTYPLGFTAAALAEVRDLAGERGYQISEVA